MEWSHDRKIGPNDWGDALKMQYVVWQLVGPALQAASAKNTGRTYDLKNLPDPGNVIKRPPGPKLGEILARLRS